MGTNKFNETCSICGARKKTGILGNIYCPKQHGNGQGDSVMNQPASNPS